MQASEFHRVGRQFPADHKRLKGVVCPHERVEKPAG